MKFINIFKSSDEDIYIFFFFEFWTRLKYFSNFENSLMYVTDDINEHFLKFLG